MNVFVLEKEAIRDPMFDLYPGKHGHTLDFNGNFRDHKKEATDYVGGRIKVAMLDITAKTLFQIADFVDDMEGTDHENDITIVVKEANKEHNIPAKIGIFAI